MEPEELVLLIKDLRKNMRLAHQAKTEMVEQPKAGHINR